MPSFEKDKKSGKWSVRFRAVEAGAVKQKRIRGFDTKREANSAYLEYIEKQKLKKEPSNKLTFRQLFLLYSDYLKMRFEDGTLKESSYYTFIKNGEKRLLPFFGSKKLHEITARDVETWQDELSKIGLSLGFRSRLRVFLSSIFNWSIRKGYNDSNPVYFAEKINKSVEPKEMQIWSPEEFKRFIAVVDDSVYNSLFLLLFYSGCRKGEALALLVGDVDFNSGTININKTLSSKTLEGGIKITAPKNAQSRRIIALPDIVLNALKINIEANSLKAKHYLFGKARPLPEETMRRKFNDYIQKAGVKQIRIHDLRHSHASFLIQNGENIVTVSKRLGHSNIERTLNTYSHCLPNAEQQLISRLNTLISPD